MAGGGQARPAEPRHAHSVPSQCPLGFRLLPQPPHGAWLLRASSGRAWLRDAPSAQGADPTRRSPCSLSPAACSLQPAACSLSLSRCRFPKATFARFQPHSSSFLDVTDHG